MTVDESNKRTIDNLCRDIGRNIINNAKDELKQSGRVYKGQLSDSLQYNNTSKTITSDAPHARATEFGYPIGVDNIPIIRLREWVKDHFTVDDPRKIDDITFAIREKIAKEGIPATHFMLKSILREVSKNRM